MKRFLNGAGAALCAACAAWPVAALSQAYPAKPVRLILPFTAGIGTDVFARKIAPLMSDSMGQPVVAENRTGASGAIGAEVVFKAPPDGYTMLFTASAQTVALAHSMRSLPYDPQGFTPVMAAIEPLIVIVIRPAIPAANMKDFIEYARRSPGKVSFGSSGMGSSFHMFGVSLATLSGIDLLHVPYKGTNLGVNDIMGGVLDMGFGSLAGIGSLIQSGKVRAVAIMGERRAGTFPDLPAVTEIVPGIELSPGWFAFWGPPRLPQPIVQRFHAELLKAMNTPDMKAWYETNGFTYLGTSPETLRAMQQKGNEVYGRIFKALGLKAE